MGTRAGSSTRAVIRGVGVATGEVVCANDRFELVMDTDDEWIRSRTGIEQRDYVRPGTAASDLGAIAGRLALEDAGVEPGEVDYLLCATLTADYYFPGSGVLIQDKLSLPPIPSLDIRQQCAGFVYGLQLADVLIRTGSARTVLLVGVEIHSAFFPYSAATWAALRGDSDQPVSDQEREWNTRWRYITPLFGDAAGAMVLTASTDSDAERGVLASELRGDGGQAELLYVPGVGSCRLPMIDQQSIDEGLYVPRMDGRGLFKEAVEKMPEATRRVLDRAGYTLDDLDFGIFHQANLRINQAAQKALGLPDSKVHNNIDRHGNTTAATLPLCFYDAREAGKVREGDLVAFTAFGAGIQWGSVLVRL